MLAAMCVVFTPLTCEWLLLDFYKNSVTLIAMKATLKAKVDKLNRHELRNFILERREVGDYDKLERQAYALDRLIVMAVNEGKMQGKAEMAAMF